MRFAVAQSGGPTCAINASLVGVYEAACELRSHTQTEILGVLHGIQGLLDEQFIDLDKTLSDADNRALLCRTPATRS